MNPPEPNLLVHGLDQEQKAEQAGGLMLDSPGAPQGLWGLGR